jgi:y4mF family transcriptional regulator
MPRYTPADVGQIVRNARKSLGATQRDLAMTSGTGMRFIVELEQGKATCQLGKVLTVLNTLGVVANLVPPPPREPGVSSLGRTPTARGRKPSRAKR